MKTFSNHYEVVVAGGGSSGIAAAVSSARQGAKTALIERFGIVGGMLTSGYVNPVLGLVEPGTMRDEVLELLEAKWIETRNGKEMSINTEDAKHILLKFAVDAGVDVFLQTPVVDVINEDNALKGVVISTQEGLKKFYASVVVDATGDGVVSSLAGAKWEMGRESDGCCQPTSLEFSIDNVDEERGFTCWGGSDPVKMPDGQKYSEFCKQKMQKGYFPKM